jgi:YVTN family beta-propeller protein
VAAAVTAVLVSAGCSATPATPSGASSPQTSASTSASSASPSPTATASSTASPTPALDLLPGMPPPLDTNDVYAADRPNLMSPVVAGFRPLVYVPNSGGNTVTVIDPRTARVIRTFVTGRNPQHVVPSWDLKTLWVNNDLGNSLTPIDPRTGRPGRNVAVHDPYNLYFTPDGKYAVVMASLDRALVFRDPHTMAVRHVTPVPCYGVNHADFSTDGRYFLVSCEFSGQMLKVDTASMKVVGSLRLPRRPGHMRAKPQDVKMSPDGKTFYVADMMSDGLWLLDGARFRITGFIHTGRGAHGLYVTRDSKRLLITNRDEGTISVLDFASRRLVARWRIPGGGSPDMGGLSSDGNVFWVSGRYNGVVYAISTATGRLLHKIRVGANPHGLCVYPQPGRYSLGHTGVFR